MDSKSFAKLIQAVLPFSEGTLEHLWHAFLVFQNEAKSLNLTGLKTDKERVVNLFADSLAALKFFDFSKTTRAADLGTGGGFPGIPLAITLPHIQWTLIDATSKKVNAVSRIIHETLLPNAEAVWGRSEQLAADKVQFELVTTKALAHFMPMLELALPLVEKQGHLIAYVGPTENPKDPQVGQVLKKYHAKLVSSDAYELPEGFGTRQLLVFKRDA